MKTIKLATYLVVFVFMATTTQAQKNALEYMQIISNEYKSISEQMWNYTSAVAKDKKAKKIESNRKALLKTLSDAEKKIAKMSDFKGDSEYRDSAVACLRLNYNVINEDYAKIVDLEEIAEQSYDLMEAYLLAQDLANQKVSESSARLNEVERKFAEKNNITLVESTSKTGERLKKAGEMWTYYNEVYLIFFKSYKQEAYLLDALSKGDLSGVQQNNEALKATATEGIEKLKAVGKFKNTDNTLVDACREMLQFYLDEAENQIPNLSNFYLTKEKFEKTKTAFESKKEKDRTKEDVDQFNKMVGEYNSGINTFNATNEALNKERNKRLNTWNKTTSSFTSKHVK